MIDPVAVTIGPLKIHWYGIIMTSAFVFGVLLAQFHARKFGIDPEHILNMAMYIIPLAIIGARAYYVIFEWDNYKDNIWEAFAIWHGGLAIHGGLIGGTLGGIWYVSRHKMPVLLFGDLIMPSVILGQAIGRWGNFINQEAHGGEVPEEFMNMFPNFIKEQMFINGAYYEPTFLYESLWNLLVFGILMLLLHKFKKFDGQVMFSYLILYSVGRYFIEGLRTDSLMLGPLRVAQLVSLILILAGIALLYWAWKRDAGRNDSQAQV
ncbi:prolipoprotein diacylglyceryl transferase [Effusibacillus lacus]|uniref:Phosphatidylglycerol--prolipoprotein diacylglyceryl transferase n=1 Tax=Effusibacillus lacus TaxID=1348429 RepID=A0A292YMQ1_9BACL|nr:prolipoprotein diacylglyceryl transferase [Effusibacillus lacus]TCS76875.1 prolipoprotein diacylglyceryl transferase [Effusibacillus lacus]GAX91208.1 prolipoprotein diacylglyceryl transferase [Effusibacillus lacus]